MYSKGGFHIKTNRKFWKTTTVLNKTLYKHGFLMPVTYSRCYFYPFCPGQSVLSVPNPTHIIIFKH